MREESEKVVTKATKI